MEIFEWGRKFCQNLYGVYLPDHSSKLSRISSVLLNLVNFLIISMEIYGSVAKYYFERESMTVVQMIFVFLQIFLNMLMIVSYMIYCCRKSELVRLMDEYQAIVNSRFDISTEQIYVNVDWKTELFSKWAFVVENSILAVGLSVSTLFYCVHSLIRGEIDVHKWPNIIHIRFSTNLGNQFDSEADCPSREIGYRTVHTIPMIWRYTFSTASSRSWFAHLPASCGW